PASEVEAVLRSTSVISFATSATTPHVPKRATFLPRTIVLHISLRDLTPDHILGSHNVTDDVDHVCRAHTSVPLTERLTGRRDFIRCSLPDLLLGRAPKKRDPDLPTVFSPFGLGILDLAVSKFVYASARRKQIGIDVQSFLPGRDRPPA